jgi:SH3-like domain-containing protein
MKSFLLRGLVVLCALVSAPAFATDYRQITENNTILFDSPSSKGTKLFILSAGMPVEVIVNVAGWVKVRDAGGSLGWVEPKQVGARTQVQVKVPFATIRARAEEAAPAVFSAERDVLLTLAESAPSSGWIRVNHRDGVSGYVRIEALFGI